MHLILLTPLGALLAAGALVVRAARSGSARRTRGLARRPFSQ
jgi:hypothetical protein